MIRRANEEGITVKELGDRFIEEYYERRGCAGHRAARRSHPRATEHIPDIIALIEKLIDKGLAYACDNGDVYYDIRRRSPATASSAARTLRTWRAARASTWTRTSATRWISPLWKAQKPGEPAWESPWGMGRPGWHIECSAMSMKYLGETLDIHCGGQDLDLPAPRKRDRPERGRDGQAVRPLLDAQRLHQCR